MIASATQIKVKSFYRYFYFFWKLHLVKKQLKNSKGLRSVDYNGLRTLTIWEDIDSMKKFRNESHHLDVMRNKNKIGSVKSVRWEVSEVPEWEEVKMKLDSIEMS